MNWKKRQREIENLRKRFGKDRSLARSFPDLSVPKRSTPCTNGMSGSTAPLKDIQGRKEFPVGNLHKSGLQLITPGSKVSEFNGSKK